VFIQVFSFFSFVLLFNINTQQSLALKNELLNEIIIAYSNPCAASRGVADGTCLASPEITKFIV
jgi:hypothetical protein